MEVDNISQMQVACVKSMSTLDLTCFKFQTEAFEAPLECREKFQREFTESVQCAVNSLLDSHLHEHAQITKDHKEIMQLRSQVEEMMESSAIQFPSEQILQADIIGFQKIFEYLDQGLKINLSERIIEMNDLVYSITATPTHIEEQMNSATSLFNNLLSCHRAMTDKFHSKLAELRNAMDSLDSLSIEHAESDADNLLSRLFSMKVDVTEYSPLFSKSHLHSKAMDEIILQQHRYQERERMLNLMQLENSTIGKNLGTQIDDQVPIKRHHETNESILNIQNTREKLLAGVNFTISNVQKPKCWKTVGLER
jgi:hypothetical protein